jgi:hypothetical protein
MGELGVYKSSRKPQTSYETVLLIFGTETIYADGISGSREKGHTGTISVGKCGS